MIPTNILQDISKGKRIIRLEWWGKHFRTYARNIAVPSINHPDVISIINTKCHKMWQECKVYNITNNPELFNQECKVFSKNHKTY